MEVQSFVNASLTTFSPFRYFCLNIDQILQNMRKLLIIVSLVLRLKIKGSW